MGNTNEKIETLLESLEHITTLDNLKQSVLNLREVYGVKHVVYHAVNRDGDPYALASYSQEWAEHYRNNQLWQIDPVVFESLHKFHPYSWDDLSIEKKKTQEFMLDAQSAGVGSCGLSIPIRGPRGEFALFSISSDAKKASWGDFISENINSMILSAHFIHQTARRIENLDSLTRDISLSPREVDALRLLALGHNRSKAAEILGISEHTFRVYVETARHKLSATNTLNAVAKAQRYGLIVL